MDQHAFNGKMRGHSDDSSDDIYGGSTPIGSCSAEAASRLNSINARHHQQRPWAFQRPSPILPSTLREEYRLQTSLEPYQGAAHQPPLRLNSISATSLEPSYLDSSFQSFNETLNFSTLLQDPSLSLESLMQIERRRQPRTAAECSPEYGSDDSKTLPGSWGSGTAHQASQDRALDLMFNTTDGVPYSLSDNSAGVCQPMDESGNFMGGSAILATQDQSDHRPGHWHHENDSPWTLFDASSSQNGVPIPRPRIPTRHEEALYGSAVGPAVQHLNRSPAYPSQILSPLSNPSQQSGDMMLVDSTCHWPEPDLTYAEESTLDNDLMFPEDRNYSGTQTQEQADDQNSLGPPPIFDRLSPNSSHTWLHRESHRTVPFLIRESTFFVWPPPQNSQASNNMGQRTANFHLNPQSNVPDEGDQHWVKPNAIVSTTSTNREWANTIISAGSFRESGGQTTSKGKKKKKGRRNGPLDEEAATKAAEVRRSRACWRCWSLHYSCDTNKICDRCQRRASSLSSTSCICNRAHIYDYRRLFLPELVAVRRDPASIEKLRRENVNDFTENKIEVEVTSGPAYPTITIPVYEFRPTNDDFLFMYHAAPNVNSPVSNLARIYAPPFGLRDDNDEGRLKKRCYEHIKAITEHSRFPKDATKGDAAPASLEVFKAINRYRESKPISGNAELLSKVMELLAMHFVMSKIITFSEDSANTLIKSLRSPMQLPYGRSMSSKLLNSQIKGQIQLLQRKHTSDVLEKLHTELRQTSKASWATSLCVIIVLSMCMEAIQLAIDGFIVHKLVAQDATDKISESREDGFELSRFIDEKPFGKSVESFHMMYRSGKYEKKSDRKAFNPIRNGVDAAWVKEVDEGTVQLVKDIRHIMRNYREEIEQKARDPTWGDEQNLLDDHYRFRRQNSGRLVAKFLKSFLEVS